MLFEVFTNSEEESNALRIISNTAFDPKTKIKNTIIGTVKQVLGESTIQQLKKVIKKTILNLFIRLMRRCFPQQ